MVSASDLPLSILIVGVGGADYKEMEVLDGDKGERLESSSGRVASRDIVQFVALRDIQCESSLCVLDMCLGFRKIGAAVLVDQCLCVCECRWRGVSGRSASSGIAFTVFGLHEKP